MHPSAVITSCANSAFDLAISRVQTPRKGSSQKRGDLHLLTAVFPKEAPISASLEVCARCYDRNITALYGLLCHSCLETVKICSHSAKAAES